MQYGDETVTLEVRSNLEGAVVYAIGDRAMQGESMNAQEQRAFFMDTILAYLAGWDIEDDDGVMPITAESMLRLPQPLVFAIFDAIKEQIGPNSPTAPTSEPGSEATANLDASLSGTPSSNGQSTLASLPGNS
jgi:hypothetical protein